MKILNVHYWFAKVLTLIISFLGANAQMFAQITTSDFVTTWKTDNPGVEIDEATIIIPTEGNGYNYDVDWNNDGVFDQLGLTGDAIHTYQNPGTYTVRIRGDFPRFYLNNNRKIREKLISIDQWGNNPWASMASAFNGSINMELLATDVPNLDNLTDMSTMFSDARLLNTNINNWDVSKVTNMEGIFFNALSYNQPMDNWNMANVQNLASFFNRATSFNQNINNWDVSNVAEMQLMFNGASSFNQPLQNWDVSKVSNMRFMFTNAVSFNQNIENWNVENVTNMQGMFSNAVSFNQNIENWNVGNVTNMQGMFKIEDAKDPFGLIPPEAADSSFNQPLENWDVSQVTNMKEMFYGAVGFNQPLNGWNVGNVTNMEGMFYDALNFDQPLNNWNVTNVTNMSNMFRSSPGPPFGGGPEYQFNQPINEWDVSNVTDMSGMFVNSEKFNQTLADWDVSNVVTMEAMFYGTKSFNQNIQAWNTGNVTSMYNMFGFTQSFNQSLDSWDVSNVTDMGAMFQYTKKFNQPIGNWDVSNATLMDAMFLNAQKFNHPLDSWNIVNVTDMDGFLQGTGITIENYDAMLAAWSVLPLQNGVLFGAGTTTTYCESEDARNILTNEFGWIITDGGLNCKAYTLPNGNFSVLGAGISCIGKIDGTITIIAQLEQRYRGILSKGDFYKEREFLSNWEIDELEAGSYTLCITVPGQIGYERCFEINISAPEALNVNSKINQTDRSVTLALDGGKKYFIQINEKSYTTESSEITLPLDEIQNNIIISTNKGCQGTYQEVVVVNSNFKVYPNPVSKEPLSVFVGSEIGNIGVNILIFDSNGSLKMHKHAIAVNGVISIDTESLSPSVYFLSMELPNKTLKCKIIKR